MSKKRRKRLEMTGPFDSPELEAVKRIKRRREGEKILRSIKPDQGDET